MTKHFTFEFIGEKYNNVTKRWKNEYIILRNGESYTHCGTFIVGYKNVLNECKRLEKYYQNKRGITL